MVVVAMEDSLCELLWALFEGKSYCNKFGAGVFGNQIQPPRDGMRLVLAICCCPGACLRVPTPTISLCCRSATRLKIGAAWSV